MSKCLATLMLLALVSPLAFPADQPRVAVVEFSSHGVAADDAAIITEILRSKLVVSGAFEVVDRANIDKILAELELQASGATQEANSLRVGRLLNARYIVTGSLMRIGKSLSITAHMVDVETGQIKASAEKKADNMDTVSDVLQEVLLDLIRSGFRKDRLTFSAPAERAGAAGASRDMPGERFTFSTETHGVTIDAGLGYLFSEASHGFGISAGFTVGKGKWWSGFYTMWSFPDAPNVTGRTPVISNFGGMTLVYGDRIDGLALQLGLGAGYDFALGIVVSPNIGAIYKGFHLRYCPSWDYVIEYQGTSASKVYHQIEAGYSLFLGSRGKPVTEFR